ncbi:MSC_0882 family membrane protein [Mycoplasmopsis gallopavonis]|uniref:Uncharacterized protein n=1 Tax=Mycoplasmopsis gallopavonis TaxID=76629 RepID=A0A449AZS6_9BACT|nr:hypothetical protein [Mycoplasmopsis gallopavonis]RIV16728.1 hypothetical protein D1113_01240 [Mycoplasmopsis gallopavonis]VEU72966.1 Uncharacterised protein [Mycoplasmopsis gallopavonis]
MNNFQPKDNSSNNVNLKTTEIPYGIDEQSAAKVYVDPKNEISPLAHTTIRKEKTIRFIAFVFWLVIFVSSLVAIGVAVGISKTNDYKNASFIGWYILFGLSTILGLVLFIKNAMDFASWRKTEKQFRYNYKRGDVAASTMFAELYKTLTLKNLRLMWLYFFFLTYFGLLLVIVAALNASGTWTIGKEPTSTSNGSFFIKLDWPKILESWFGKIWSFEVIGLIVLVTLTVLLLVVWLYDRKRIKDIQMNLGTDGQSAATLIASVQESRRSENKAWIKFYIFVFILTVLVPLAIFIFLVYTKVIRRKK